MSYAERWAATIDGTAYAIDEQTAIRVDDGRVDVVSEGQWTKFEPRPTGRRPPDPVHS